MKSPQLYYPFLFVLLIYACHQKQQDLAGSEDEVTIVSEWIPIELNGKQRKQLLVPAEMLVIDTLLVIRNAQIDELFTLVDLKNQTLINHFGRKGRGPKEFTSTSKMVRSVVPRSFEFFESNVCRVARVNLDSVIAGTENYFEILTKFEVKGKWNEVESFSKPLSAYFLKDSLFLVIDYLKDGMIGIRDVSTNTTRVFFEYPDNELNNINPQVKHHVYQHIFRKHPSKPLFVNAFFHSDWIKIYTLKNNSLEDVYSHYTFLPQYRNSNDGGAPSYLITGKIGNVNMDVNSQNIYVLKSDVEQKDAFNEGSMDFSINQLFVYDWEGEKVAHYQLPHNIETFAVDENNKYLYALISDPEPKIAKYTLPEIDILNN